MWKKIIFTILEWKQTAHMIKQSVDETHNDCTFDIMEYLRYWSKLFY